MTGTESAMVDDLSLRLSLPGRHLIEASAGTGKTFAIAGLYARWIVEGGFRVRQVLVLTFTRAATEELRQRLRRRLDLCARWAACLADADRREPDIDDAESVLARELVTRQRDPGTESAVALASRLQLAVLEMDQAAIFTIDGFCQRVLKDWSVWFDDVIEGAELEPDDRPLLEDFAADAWLRAAAEDDDGLTRDCLRKLGDSPESLAGLLTRLVHFDGAIEPASSGPVDAAKLPDAAVADQALCDAWRREGAGAVATFEHQFQAGHLNGASYKKDKPALLQRVSGQLAEGRVPAGKDLAPFALSQLEQKTKKDFQPFPHEAAFAAIDDWQAVQAEREDALRRHVAWLLHQLVDQARSWLDRRKRDLRRISYADPLQQLEQGLLHGAHRQLLAKHLRAYFSAALVDEFQDTNPRQYRILEAIYGDTGNLSLIGDPKQAIYGFRGGDVFAYLRAAKDARDSGRKPEPLKHNFRACPGMLRAIDALFTRTPRPFVQDGIAFEPVKPGNTVADGLLRIDDQPVTPMTLWPIVPERMGKKVNDQRAALAEQCAGEVARLLAHARLGDAGKPLEPGGIAVLVNKHAEAMRVHEALRRHGVPAVCVQRQSIYASREALELLQLFDALLAPSSIRLARGALATELLGRRLSAVLDDDAGLRASLAELDDLREAWRGRGLVAMVEKLAECHAPRLLARGDGERMLVNLLQLAEALAGDARQLAGEPAVRDLLARRMRDADEHNEDEQLRLESDAARVQVLTLHASKGLEYDVVLLPFAAMMGPHKAHKGEPARYHDGDGRAAIRLLLHDSDERKAPDATPAAQAEHDALAAQYEESLAECMRKFYVGVTRARHACWVSTGAGKVMQRLLPDADSAQALAEDCNDIVVDEACESGRADGPVAASVATGSARRFAGHIDRDWWTHSFSQWAGGEGDPLVLGEGAGDESDHDALPPVPDPGPSVPTWPRGPHYGNAVHAVLEQADMAAWKDGVEAGEPEHGRIRQALRGAGYQGEELARAIGPTARLIHQALATPILPGVCLADIPETDRRAEMEFHFGMAGVSSERLLSLLHQHGHLQGRRQFGHAGERLRGMMTGIIDLVFRQGDQWWIVDYKTNLLGATGDAYAPERLVEAMAAHDYDLQYLIYTVALHRWLRLMCGSGYDYERDFGGVRYLFLRGMQPASDRGHGVHAARPSAELIRALDALLQAPGEAA